MKKSITFYGYKCDKLKIYMDELYSGQLNMSLLENETKKEAERLMIEDGENQILQKYKVTLTLERVKK